MFLSEKFLVFEQVGGHVAFKRSKRNVLGWFETVVASGFHVKIYAENRTMFLEQCAANGLDVRFWTKIAVLKVV